MKPIPVQFHVGPLLLHTYGIGLAITFYFAYKYYDRRLKSAGYPTEWLPAVFGWIVVAAILGARIVHVVANWSYYSANAGQILAVWHGGLSSFGGLLFALPIGTYLAVRRCPNLTALKALDLAAPVLILAWAVGRLLGPQLMVAGGGRETTAWYGMAYAGQAGKRVPVPLIQAFDCLVIYALLLVTEARYRPRATGFIIASAATLYGLARFFEENVFLHQNDHVGGILVQLTGVGLVVIGALWMMALARRGPSAPVLTTADVADTSKQQRVKVLPNAEAASDEAASETGGEASEDDSPPVETLFDDPIPVTSRLDDADRTPAEAGRTGADTEAKHEPSPSRVDDANEKASEEPPVPPVQAEAPVAAAPVAEPAEVAGIDVPAMKPAESPPDQPPPDQPPPDQPPPDQPPPAAEPEVAAQVPAAEPAAAPTSERPVAAEVPAPEAPVAEAPVPEPADGAGIEVPAMKPAEAPAEEHPPEAIPTSERPAAAEVSAPEAPVAEAPVPEPADGAGIEVPAMKPAEAPAEEHPPEAIPTSERPAAAEVSAPEAPVAEAPVPEPADGAGIEVPAMKPAEAPAEEYTPEAAPTSERPPEVSAPEVSAPEAPAAEVPASEPAEAPAGEPAHAPFPATEADVPAAGSTPEAGPEPAAETAPAPSPGIEPAAQGTTEPAPETAAETAGKAES